MAHAEEVVARSIEVATCVLEGIVHSGFLDLIEHDAVGVVVIRVDFVARVAGHADDGTQAIEQVVVLAPIGDAFVVQEATTTAREVRRVFSSSYLAASLIPAEMFFLKHGSNRTDFV
jgi:hypothetical protein